MAVLKKYNLSGAEVGEVKIEDTFLESSVNAQLIKDYLTAIRANARQWSANTQSRPEVSHSGQKPHPQKGTGKARQGYLGAPQYKGGGRVHAPKPKFDQHVRINKKERQAAVRHLIIEKITGQNVHVLDSSSLNEPKTKILCNFLKARGLDARKVLFLADASYQSSKENDGTTSAAERHQNLVRSLKNIQKVDFGYVPNVNGYELALHQEIVVLDTACDELMVLLGGKK
ncbi:MAG: 50S ribosomal protein L4 [Chlamydiae bacterium]|nr:50S ribosomal protein L4 [Chlamydiota bacterium]